MKTLDEHNREVESRRGELLKLANPAGVLCPSCMTQMVYTGQVAMRMPPMHEVKCTMCGKVGYKK